MKRKCYKCKESKELTEFFRQNRICTKCKEEMYLHKKEMPDMTIKPRVKSKLKDFTLENSNKRVKIANKRHRAYDAPERNVKVEVKGRDIYGRTVKSVRPNWDKILLEIKEKIKNHV